MTKSILILILLINIAYSSICNYTIDYKNKEFNEVRKTIDKLFKENNLVVVKEIVNKRFHQKSKYKAYYASILYAISSKSEKDSLYWLKQIFNNASSSLDIIGLTDLRNEQNNKYKKQIKNYIDQSNFLLEKEKLFLLARITAKDWQYTSYDKGLLIESSNLGCGIASFALANYYNKYDYKLPKEFLQIGSTFPTTDKNGDIWEIVWDINNKNYSDFTNEDLKVINYTLQIENTPKKSEDITKIINKIQKDTNLKINEISYKYIDNLLTFKHTYLNLYKTNFFNYDNLKKQKKILVKYYLSLNTEGRKKAKDNFIGFFLKYKYYYKYLHLSAEQGFWQAQYWLGNAYSNKDGEDKIYSLDSFGQILIKKDDEKALYWYKKAAYSGQKAAINSLARFYYQHYSTKFRDNTKALYWYKKYAEYGGDYWMFTFNLFETGIFKEHIKVAKYYAKKAGLRDVFKEHNLFNIPDPSEQELKVFNDMIDSFGNKEARLAFGEFKISNDDIPNFLANTTSKKINSKNWLISIATEDYDNTDDIQFSQNSANNFIKVAQKRLGISERNTYNLVGNKSTSGAIKDNLAMLLKNVKKGDTIYFYYSGHGIPVLPDNEPYILPKDKIPEMISKDKFFKLSNIYKLLSDSKASKVVAFVDSCFSGATDGKSVIKGVATSRLVPKKVSFDKSKMVVLTAGKDKQYSNMYEEKGHRLFSYFLMKSLLKGKTDINDIYKEVYTNVKDESYKMGDMKIQEPTIDGNLKLKL